MKGLFQPVIPFCRMLLCALVLLCISCGAEQENQPTDTAAGIDLLKLFDVAHLEIERPTMDLDLGARREYQRAGLFPTVKFKESEAIAVINREVQLYAPIIRGGPRTLQLQLRSRGVFGGPDNQRVTAFVNGERLGSADVASVRSELIEFEVPENLLSSGSNELFLHFDQYLTFKNFPEATEFPGDVSVVLPGIAGYVEQIYLADEKRTIQHIPEDAQHFIIADGMRALRQKPDSSFSYGLEPKADARLEIAGTISGNGIHAEIRVRTDRFPQWDVLWSAADYPPDENLRFESSISIGQFAEKPVELAFVVHADSGYQAGAVDWTQIDLTGMEQPERTPVIAERRTLPESVKHCIVIITDATNRTFLGPYGNEKGLTPRIDAFAGDALVFDYAVAPGSQTAKSVSSMFSGVLPDYHGVFGVTTSFPEHLPTLPAAFRDTGFHTVVFAGIRAVMSNFNLTRDFHENVKIRPKNAVKDETSEMNLKRIRSTIEKAAKRDQPLFLYIHLLPPHWPYKPPAPWFQPEEGDAVVDTAFKSNIKTRLRFGMDENLAQNLNLLKKYYEMNVRYADALVGDVLDTLKENGLYDSSLILLTADHGEEFGDHGFIGHGRSVYNDIVRLPFIMRLPEGPRGRSFEKTGLIDLFPTFVELFGLHTEMQDYQGRSMAGQFMGSKGGDDPLYFSRTGSEDMKIFAVHGSTYKLIYFFGDSELYDIQADPLERNNIARQLPATVAWFRTEGLKMIHGGQLYRRFQNEELELSDEEVDELKDLGYLQ